MDDYTKLNILLSRDCTDQQMVSKTSVLVWLLHMGVMNLYQLSERKKKIFYLKCLENWLVHYNFLETFFFRAGRIFLGLANNPVFVVAFILNKFMEFKTQKKFLNKYLNFFFSLENLLQINF